MGSIVSVPRVEHGDRPLQVVLRYPRVGHGRADVLVPQVLLDDSQVSAVSLQEFDAARRAVAASLQGWVALGPRAGQPLCRLRSAAAATTTGRRSARLEGFSLHADVAVPVHRRDQLERLVRCLVRPRWRSTD